MKERGLTPKQARFVDEYLKDLNATQAAIRCGLQRETAEQQGRACWVMLGRLCDRQAHKGAQRAR